MFSSLKESGDYVETNSASGLRAFVSKNFFELLDGITYTDNGDSLNRVSKAGGLVLSVLGHLRYY